MRKYNCNEDIFLDRSEKTYYWAGFLAADGNISDRFLITLSLKQSDHDHVCNFRDFIGSTAPVVKYRKSSIFRMTSKKLAQNLIKFNIVPRKTATYQIPLLILNDDNIKHFIRGYFDGDGWFSQSKDDRIAWGICGNKIVVEKIKNVLEKNCNLHYKGYLGKQNNIYKLQKICNFLWGDATVYLDRKKIIADKIMSRQLYKLDENEIIKLYKFYKSSHLVAKMMGCSPGTVLKVCKKNNIPFDFSLKGERIKNRKNLNISYDLLKNVYNTTVSISEVAKLLGHSQTTIRKYLLQYKII